MFPLSPLAESQSSRHASGEVLFHFKTRTAFVTLVLFPPLCSPPPPQSLDPENDPLCVLLLIDFLCLRAREYTFLTRMFQEWEVSCLAEGTQLIPGGLPTWAGRAEGFCSQVEALRVLSRPGWCPDSFGMTYKG